MLSPLLAGENSIDDIILNPSSWYLENSIELYTNNAVSSIDPIQQQVTSSDGRQHAYDRLIIATGSTPFVPPIPGIELPNVVCFRSIDDVQTMLDVAKQKGKALVIGGGLLVLEAAGGLLKQGMDVTVVHLLDHLMETQLNNEAAKFLKQDLEARGIKFVMQGLTEAIVDEASTGEKRATGIKLADGRVLSADLVVLSVGIRPATALAANAQIKCERGIIVNDLMQTSANNIYAVGECIQHRDRVFGLVAPLYEQAKVLAQNLVANCENLATYVSSEVGTKLKVNGIDLFSAGVLYAGDDGNEITLSDPINKTYKKVVIKDNRVKGIVLYGDVREATWLFQLLKDESDISDRFEQLLYGQSFGEAGGTTELERVAALPNDTEVCGCNGISKGDIVTAISEQGCQTLEAIRAHTTASASCGSCTTMVELVLASSLGESYCADADKSMCVCTCLTHEKVRHEIKTQSLKTIPEIVSALNWRSSDGCHHCRPALNFYLLVTWPGEYTDDPRSRHISKRVHANIQKDGTYAVIPRIWGGLTSAVELRMLGEIAEKYQTAVKITGGQRIALAGVTKENLPSIWKDLNEAGFISGHAYGKALRSVKTCVGDLLCSYGIRDSISLGIEIEKMAWGAWTPHKAKLGVSGCPRNCAEATIKDLGFVATEAGWEVYVGGNGGARATVAQLLTRLNNSEEAKLFAAAFLQLYREEGRYKERTADWLARIGIGFLTTRLVDDLEERKALTERFLYAMECSQFDPWQEEVQKEDQSEYQTIKLIENI